MQNTANCLLIWKIKSNFEELVQTSLQAWNNKETIWRFRGISFTRGCYPFTNCKLSPTFAFFRIKKNTFDLLCYFTKHNHFSFEAILLLQINKFHPMRLKAYPPSGAGLKDSSHQVYASCLIVILTALLGLELIIVILSEEINSSKATSRPQHCNRDAIKCCSSFMPFSLASLMCSLDPITSNIIYLSSCNFSKRSYSLKLKFHCWHWDLCLPFPRAPVSWATESVIPWSAILIPFLFDRKNEIWIQIGFQWALWMDRHTTSKNEACSIGTSI